MAGEDASRPDAVNAIPRAGYALMAIWAAGILLLYGMGGCFGVRWIHEYKAEGERSRQVWVNAGAGGAPASAGGTASTPAPAVVHVGMSVDRMGELDLKEGGWTADFRVWFRWRGDTVNPGANFDVVNGKVLERERIASAVRDGERFERYGVTARMAETFDTRRMPLSGNLLTIQIEDRVDDASRLRYVTDESGIDLRRLRVPQSVILERVVPAVTQRRMDAEPPGAGAPDGGGALRSVFVVTMFGRTPAGGTYLRLFQALFASVAICMIVFFIKPTHVDPRFGLPVGAFFAAVGNNISVVSLIPQSGQITLIQMINAIGLGTIFLTLVQSAISLYIYDSMGRERYSRVFDAVSFLVLGSGYVVLNLMLPMAAR